MEFYRGDIFYVHKLGGTVGTEQEAGRPAVIVSNNLGNKSSNSVTVVYLTTQDKKPLQTHCEVIASIQSTAMCETVTTVSKERLGNYVRTCSEREMKRIDECLMFALGLGDIEIKPKGNLDGAVKALNEQIDNLTMKLEGAERECDDLRAANEEWKKVAENLKSKMAELNAQKAPAHDPAEVVVLTTERNLYKKQYEMLLEKMIG